MTPLLLQEGQRHGLLILRQRIVGTSSPSGGRKPVWWMVECSCSPVKKLILENSIRRGAARSCGCVGKAKPQLEGVLAALRFEYRSYRSRARKLGREFTITEAQFIVKMLARCAYCNKRPSRVTGRKRRRGSGEYYHQTAVVGGIDRLDSSKGYTPENTVPCCARCNNEKNNKTVEQYLARRFERTVKELCRLVSPHASF